MEINTQQIESLLHLQEQQAQTSRKNATQPEGFNTILLSQLADTERPVSLEAEPALTGAALYSQIMLNESGGEKASPDAAVMQAAMDQASATG